LQRQSKECHYGALSEEDLKNFAFAACQGLSKTNFLKCSPKNIPAWAAHALSRQFPPTDTPPSHEALTKGNSTMTHKSQHPLWKLYLANEALMRSLSSGATAQTPSESSAIEAPLGFENLAESTPQAAQPAYQYRFHFLTL
jgi:hypothetical protein